MESKKKAKLAVRLYDAVNKLYQADIINEQEFSLICDKIHEKTIV